YTPQPYYYINGGGGSYAMLSLNSAGVLRYFYNTYASSAIFETWGTGYSCVTGKVIESGSPTVTQEQVGIVNAANGTLLGALYSNATVSELYAATIGQNGNLYTISSNLCFCTSGVGSFTNTLQAWNIAGVTAAPIWKTVIPNYNFADYSTKNLAGIPDNGVGTSCTSVYTSDGLDLFQFNINTGAKTAGPIVIPGGSNTLGVVNSGIAVDPVCGYIYVGSQTDIQVYNSALAPVTTYPTPGIVNDLSFYNGVLTAVGATSSSSITFVAQFAGQTCPPPIITHTNTTCGNNNGTANIANPTFCVGPYTYLWTPSGKTTQNVTGLSAGTYSVTISSSGMCDVVMTDTVTIFNSASFTMTMAQTNVKCNGAATGSATVTATGGTPAYTYAWTPVGGTNATASNLTAGTYTVTVKDATGCTATMTVTITQPPALTAPITTVPVKCNGAATGSATVTAGGGTPGYVYTWAPSGGTNATASNLTAGTYTVTVKDANGCTITATAVITQPPVLTATTTVVNVKCNGGATGSATVTAGGGTPAYVYTWAPSGGTNALASN
ncbi:MAG TPA: hypothetical protein VNZ45_10070, partial [Bacteroidia bacterium]|nr:hypothetical protein [Bacteroidia bacterium]